MVFGIIMTKLIQRRGLNWPLATIRDQNHQLTDTAIFLARFECLVLRSKLVPIALEVNLSLKLEWFISILGYTN